MKPIRADYINGVMRIASVLTTLIIGMTFSMVSIATAAVPGMNAVEAIHKGNAVEAIHKGKIENVKENLMTTKAVELVATADSQTSGLKNRVNNNRLENGIIGRGLLGLRGLGLGLDLEDILEE